MSKAKNTLKPKENDLILVEWDDAAGMSRWTGKEEAAAQSLAHCESVGRLLKFDKVALRMAATSSERGSVNDTSTIPSKSVRRILKLRVVSEWKPNGSKK